MIENVNMIAHHANCDSLIELADRFLPTTSMEKREFIRVIEAYRKRPDLIEYVEQLEQSIFSLLHAYFEEEAAGLIEHGR